MEVPLAVQITIFTKSKLREVQHEIGSISTFEPQLLASWVSWVMNIISNFFYIIHQQHSLVPRPHTKIFGWGLGTRLPATQENYLICGIGFPGISHSQLLQ